ncbi:MAG: cytochrome c nitrite reductase pentaheme subunit [Planctomycetes bacterium ADurb.Bin126]|nr:MAG: cytochrome c nitrite reductase pentaheme subunit [Planctomycetes bacterium ADurb.Bin126]
MAGRGQLGRSAAPIVAVLAMAALLSGGCDRRKPPARPAAATAPGAVPDQYLAPAAPATTQPLIKPQAPRPAGPLPEGAACVTPECHARLSVARQIHQPVAAGACDACHQHDTGGHRYPLKRSAQTLCTFCHAVDATALHRHAALEEGCTVCHNPHVSTAKYLLKRDTVEQVCTLCHLVPLKKFAHGPVVQGECTLCHQPHQSDHAMLLRGGEGRTFCYQCHQDVHQAVETASNVHKPLREGPCSACHDAHTSDQPRLLSRPLNPQCLECHAPVAREIQTARWPHDALTTGKGCGNCHDAHASSQPLLLKDRMDRVCLQCHDRPLQARDGRSIGDMRPSLGARFLHGPVKDGSCSACHNSHGTVHAGLLRAPFPRSFYASFQEGLYDLCFGCHDRRMVLETNTRYLTNFRDGGRNLHYVHVNRQQKGRTCRTCHALHGSNLPHHMASQVPFSGSQWPLEIGYEKTPEGGRCATTCHKPQQYDRARPAGPASRRAVPEAFAPMDGRP